jgi:hypothetical protein
MFLEHGRHGRFLLRRPKALGAQVQRVMGMCQAGNIGYQGVQLVTRCRLSKLLGDVLGAPCLGPHGQYAPQEQRKQIEPHRQPLHGWGRLKPPGETQVRDQDKSEDSPGIRVQYQGPARAEEPG